MVTGIIAMVCTSCLVWSLKLDNSVVIESINPFVGDCFTNIKYVIHLWEIMLLFWIYKFSLNTANPHRSHQTCISAKFR